MAPGGEGRERLGFGFTRMAIKIVNAVCCCVRMCLLKSMLFSNLLNIQNNDRLTIVFVNLPEPKRISRLIVICKSLWNTWQCCSRPTIFIFRGGDWRWRGAGPSIYNLYGFDKGNKIINEYFGRSWANLYSIEGRSEREVNINLKWIRLEDWVLMIYLIYKSFG